MFRLIKLAAYALLGYAIYEFWLGLSGAAESHHESDRRQPISADSRSGPRMTGPSRGGMNVPTQDASGGGSSQMAGRGVVH
jgi:hypothetical protein